MTFLFILSVLKRIQIYPKLQTRLTLSTVAGEHVQVIRDTQKNYRNRELQSRTGRECLQWHVLKPGRWTGRWTLDDGRWTMDAGRWTLDDGRWTLDDGRWTMDAGRWTSIVQVLAFVLKPGRWTIFISRFNKFSLRLSLCHYTRP